MISRVKTSSLPVEALRLEDAVLVLLRRLGLKEITALRATENYATFYSELTGERMERLSKMLGHFGANVFLAGPGVIPDEIVQNKPETDFFFTVEKGKTEH